MFFYTFLFIASVIAALVILRLYHAVVSVGKDVCSAILPSAKDSPTNHLEGVRLQTTINDTPTPWGWKEHSTPSNLARTHPARPSERAPWGWPGNKNEIREHHPGDISSHGTGIHAHANHNNPSPPKEELKKPVVGWPHREEKLEFAGKAYKITRKAKAKKTDFSSSGKPWGW
jgi:hypothetical protein